MYEEVGILVADQHPGAMAEHFKATGRRTKRTRKKTATKTSFISSNNNLSLPLGSRESGLGGRIFTFPRLALKFDGIVVLYSQPTRVVQVTGLL